MPAFGTRLKELRTEKGLSQEALARDFGITKNTVSVWERDVRKPSFLMGVSEQREPALMSDEETASSVWEEERILEESMLRCYRDLNIPMQEMVRRTIKNAYEIDKTRGALQSQTE